MIKTIPRIKTPQEAYVFNYPQAITFAETQNSIFWLPDEIKVEKDKQDLLVNLSEVEYHGVITTLKLFTKYELFVGNEYWGDIIKKRYPIPEIQRMASAFSFFELNVHAPFYSKINEILGLATEDFYNSYINDPILNSRMEFIGGLISHENELISLAGFSLIEGAILYSSFAFLKHFQSKGKNKMMNTVRGINFSVRDENIHSEAGAWLYNQTKYELELTEDESNDVETAIIDAAKAIYEHECRIIDMIFEKGTMDGITSTQMKNFVQSRLNICLEKLKIKKLFIVKYDPISEWFYDGINNFQFNDFFSGIGASYNRNWSETEFTWGKGYNK